MSIRKVEAARGVAWLTEAAQLLLRNPGPFLLMGLTLAVIGMIPLLGMIGLVVFGPALYGGIMYAAREQQAGRPVEYKQLFRAFEEPGKLQKMLMLCLPGVAAGILIAVLAVLFVGGALLAAGVSAAANSSELAGASLGGGGLLFALLAIAIGLAAYALVLFATPRVMLANAEPFAAMKESLEACLANVGAVLLFIVVLVVAAMLISLVLGIISQFLASLALAMVMTPAVSTALMLGAREVFDNAAPVPPAPPAPPPMV